jgi:uncharacterized SAM-binding protein YcdF (DUF218 family)
MKRFLIVVGVILGVLVALIVAGFFSLGFYLSPQSPLAKSDAIVAISGGETAARTLEAVQLYKDGWAKHIVFSGAALDPTAPSNAMTMARTAEAAGVPAAAIKLDEAATNTRQNATGVAAIAHTEQYHSIILVTSPYHQRRADIEFSRALGSQVTIVNHSSYDQSWRRSHWWATSYSRSLTMSELQKVSFDLATKGSQ